MLELKYLVPECAYSDHHKTKTINNIITKIYHACRPESIPPSEEYSFPPPSPTLLLVMKKIVETSPGAEKTPPSSPTLLTRMAELSKNRKASPLLKDATEKNESETLEATKEALRYLKSVFLKLDVSKGKPKEMKDAVQAVESCLNKYSGIRLARDCGPRPAMVYKPENRDAGTGMT